MIYSTLVIQANHLVFDVGIVLLQIAQVLVDLLAIDFGRSNVQQNKDHTTRLLLVEVLPHMQAASVDAYAFVSHNI